MWVNLDVEAYRKLRVMDCLNEALALSNDMDEHGRFRSKALEELYYHKKALATQYHNEDFDEIIKTGLAGAFAVKLSSKEPEHERKFEFRLAA